MSQTPSPAQRPASDAIRPALAKLVAAELRAGVHGRMAGGRVGRRAAERHRQLHAVCRLSRDAGLPVERVLVLLKAEWARAAADRPAVALRRLEERLAHLISACIATYYRTD